MPSSKNILVFKFLTIHFSRQQLLLHSHVLQASGFLRNFQQHSHIHTDSVRFHGLF